MDQSLLSLEDICFGHDDGLGLRKISFSVNEGERIAIVGGNGSGKSTLAKIISGRLEPTSGLISGKCNRPEDIGIATDLRRFNSDETVASVLQAICGGEPEQIVTNVNLNTEIVNRKIGKLSGGELYRVSLAAQLERKPAVLLLDAPSAMLDVRAADSLVSALANRDEALLVFTADITLAIETCQKVIVLNKGEIVATGQTIDILSLIHI